VLYPKKVNRDNQQVWYPEQLFIQFNSNSGCLFGLQAFWLIDEEQEKKVLVNVKNEKAIGKIFRDIVSTKISEYGLDLGGLEKAQE
jgi:hypothetical protein